MSTHTDPTPSVSLRGLTKVFGGSTVVDGLDLDVASGEFFSLLGPSGCGKTTTLRMIAGFSDPTSGTILVGGEDVTSTPPHKRDVNTVFQSYALFEHLDVRGNVGFGLRRRGLDKGTRDRRVSDMLELVELGDRGKEQPNRLSGGQRQRVALARALINEPKVLLLDEPLAALDLKLRHAMQAELKAIQREVGITFLFVTHDQDEALSMSDRVAIMNEGVIEQCGTPEDVYEHPTSVFAAGFIGTSNLMSGTWSQGCVVVSPSVSVPAPAHRARRKVTPSASRSGPRRSGSATSPPRCSGCPAPSWRPPTTAPPPSTSSRSPPTSASPSWSRTSRGCGPRTGGSPATRSSWAGCPSTLWS